MQNLVFTQLSIPELRQLFREELKDFFAANSINPTEQPDEIGGVKEAAKWTNYAESSIYDLVHKRQIPHSKRGKRLIFSRAELTAWLQENRRRTQTELTAEAAKIAA